ncbi:3-hydroxyacyl-CoA dehydrogenase family protein, partial [Rhodoblastus sp.]|uniref:3-hydroxyacyl-CoA dehydrogenase family protein n=1 Tax=Rhodoblastus sp. TaxID=1962975 RepID=UPI0026089921
MAQIRKVAVIGAGVMGAGIAAQVANSGTPVVLLDIVPAGAENRNAIAEGAVAKMLKTEPAPFMSKAAAKLVTTGNIEDHLDLLADCDWIVEAVIERLDIKQALYAKVETHRKKGSVVSSNTSTIPLATLTAGLPESFARDFVITHFFNPPRYMRLLELVTSAKNDPATVKTLTEFCDYRLGKGVVPCKDRPGFIANRLGVYWLQSAVVTAFEMGLDVEDADAIIGKPFGIPKTGVFGLIDLVGLDLMPHINASLAGSLPPDDPFHAMNRPAPLIERMIKEGYTGRKGKGGFYRVNREMNKRKEAIDLKTGDYRVQKKPQVEAIKEAGRSLTKLLSHDSLAGRYAWTVMRETLTYAAMLVGDAADEIESIDEAMRLGYNWKSGP